MVRDDITSFPKAITLQDIADRCGVSKITVSCAMRGDRRNVGQATMDRILVVAKEMGYDPSRHHAARRLAYSKTGQPVVNNVIGLFFPDKFYKMNYFRLIYEGIMDYLMGERFGVMINHTNYTNTFGSRRIDSATENLPIIFNRGDIDGAVALADAMQFLPMLEKLRAMPGFVNRPFVTLIEPMPGCSSVLTDAFAGSYSAASHLLDLGHTHLFYYTANSYPHLQRQLGYNKAMMDHGLDPATHLHSAFWESDKQFEELVIDFLLKNKQYTGVLAPNDPRAIRIFSRITESGLRIPEDISLIGCDDTDPIPDGQGNNLLTTLRLPLVQVGEEAARMLIRKITTGDHSEEQVVLSEKLVVRGTTAPMKRRN